MNCPHEMYRTISRIAGPGIWSLACSYRIRGGAEESAVEYSSILSLALLSGIIGLGVYCASCAMHVWNRRNAGSGPRVPGRFARGVAAGLVVTGVTIMLVAVIVRAAINREGRLRGEGLFTVRAPEKLQVEWIATATEVRTGDVLARFHSPEREAEIAALTLKKQILEAEKRMAQNEALELDGEVVRRQQEIASEQIGRASCRERV